MSKVTVTESYLEGIGDAIRNKLNTSQGYTPGQMAAAIESIQTGGITPTGTINITQNGQTDVTQYANADVNVPNSYAAGDEGKVVQNGALVAQTSETVTQNGTYDTTTKDEVVVNVQGGAPNLQDKTFTQNGTYTADAGYDGFDEVTVNVSGGGGSVDFSKQNSRLTGNCYIKEGRVAGFTSSASLFQPLDASGADLVVDWSQPFKIHTKLRQTGTQNAMALYGANASNVYFVLPTCEIHLDGLWFGFTTNGRSWTDAVVTTQIQTGIGIEYEIDVAYNGTTITITVSDGTNTETLQVTPAATLYNSNSYKIAFGGISKNPSLSAKFVEFDICNTYIESNGTVVWGGKS